MGPRKRAVGNREPIVTVVALNARWSKNCVHGQRADDRQHPVLNATDEVTEEWRAVVGFTSTSGSGVVCLRRHRCTQLLHAHERGFVLHVAVA